MDEMKDRAKRCRSLPVMSKGGLRIHPARERKRVRAQEFAEKRHIHTQRAQGRKYGNSQVKEGIMHGGGACRCNGKLLWGGGARRHTEKAPLPTTTRHKDMRKRAF